MRVHVGVLGMGKGEMRPEGTRLLFGSTVQEREGRARQGMMQAFDECRMVGRLLSTSGEYFKVTRQMLLWDDSTSRFKLRYDSYNFSYQDGCEMPLADGTMLSDDFMAGAIVDQTNQRIILPDGRWIDGPSGAIHTVQGTKEFEPGRKQTLDKVM